MSSYRTYVPWNKNISPNSYTGTSKTDAAPAKNKYDSSPLQKPKSEAKGDSESSGTSKLGSTYRAGSYGAGYSRDTSLTRDAGKYGASTTTAAAPANKETEKASSSIREKYAPGTGSYSSRNDVASRYKTAVEKKDCPPVTFRNLSRVSGTRSRDPSPAERDKTDNYRLYRNYARSSSREPEPTALKYSAKDSKEDINTIASRYAGRASRELSKDEPPRYSGRTSRTEVKDETPSRYGGRTSRAESKEDLTPKYTSGRLSRADTKDDSTTRYRSASRADAKEEVTPRFGRSTSRVDSKEDIPSRYARSTSRVDSKDDVSRYGRKTSVSEANEDTQKIAKALRNSRDDLSSSLSSSSLSKYSTSRHPSREDITSSSKYINSRFLPKNTIEKSFSSYSKPASLRTSNIEERRRNRDTMLSIINSSAMKSPSPARSEEKIMSPPPREIPKIPVKAEPVEMETVSVVTRGTSPTPPSQATYCRTRRADMARVIEKDITRPKHRGEMVDKELQSDRMDDTSRYCRYGSNSTVTAPWSSYLDLKFNSPRVSTPSKYVKSASSSKDNSLSSDKVELNKSKEDVSKADSEKALKKPTSEKGSTESVHSITKTSSAKSIGPKTSKVPELKSKEPSKSKSPSPSLNEISKSKSLSTPKSKSPESSNKKLLPPQVPKSETPPRSGSLHSLNTPNKDFRKSVLNMSDSKIAKKSPKRTNSLSSDSEPSSAAASDGPNLNTNDSTTISSKFSSAQSQPKTKSNSASKVPLKISIKSDKDLELEDQSRRSKTRSPSVSSEASSTTSSSDDDVNKTKSGEKTKLQSAGSSRTSMILSSADELSLDRPSKPPPSPRVKTDGPKSEAEAKSFLMRALAPVTNFFKIRHQDSTDKVSWMDSSSDDKKSEEKPKTALIKKIETGEKAWWLDESEIADTAKDLNSQGTDSQEKKMFKVRKIESGMMPWWLSENGDVPEGVVVYSNGNSNSDKYDGRKLYKIRKQESGQVEWWLDSSEAADSSKSNSSKKQSEFVNTHRIRHIDSGERSWWANSCENIPEIHIEEEPVKEESGRKLIKLLRPESGERAWWLMSHANIPDGVEKQDVDSSDDSDSDTSEKNDEPLGDRASPEGLETPRDIENAERLSPYDALAPQDSRKPKRPTHIPLFISHHTNIDEILGGSHQMLSPLMDRIFGYQNKPEEVCEEVDATQVKIHDSTAQRPVIQPNRIDVIDGSSNDSPKHQKLDDAALQLYKDGDYGSYLDLEASISEQQEEFDGFQTNKKNSIVLRTQLSVRVHTIIEKLLKSEGRELRRALFSLKQIFQEDKDLVHEFVQNDGLACLIKVGSEADQNYQNYILRALGQVMLYVDGMNGVMDHNQTVQWLYTLIASKFRLVVKTALKLLLVFVEYTDSNCMLLIKAVNAVDSGQGLMPWHNIMRLLKDFNAADTELLIYAMTLVNKCLNGIPDQDTYYDQTDALEEQGIEAIIQRYMSKQGTDLDLLQQFQIYEAVLQHEDGEDKGFPLRHLDENIRKTLRNRKSMVDSTERRRSRRHSTGTAPHVNNNNNNKLYYSLQPTVDDEDESSSSQSSGPNDHNLNGSYKDIKAVDAGVTPALRRRRERAERQRSFIREQQESAAVIRASLGIAEDTENGNYTNNIQQKINGNLQLTRNSSKKDFIPLMNAVNKLDSAEEGILKKPWVLSMMYGNKVEDGEEVNEENADTTNEAERKLLMQLKRENTVKDLTQKLASQNILHSPSDENKINRIGDMSGLISKAKEGLAKSKSKADVLKSPTTENVPKIEVKKSENELRWEELVLSMSRPLNLCDMDFTDLKSDDEADILAPTATMNGIPPPPPPFCSDSCPPPPPIASRNGPPPFPGSPGFPSNLQRPQRPCMEPTKTNTIKKNKKTVKLFWKEVREDPITVTKLEKVGGMIWDELNPITIDTQKLEHLFESRAKDLISKKQQEMNKNKEVIVLDHKRSNAINIGMTKLPPPRSIKTAILKMDATIMNREGIEKLLTMLPTEEERTKIQDAQAANPDLPLGSAEQFLLTLASISELPARLKLWAFKLDFENTEREIAEPLMDLKQGIELLRCNKTFRGILSTLLSIGIFLNGAEVKGFQIEYLAKVPEVKDTVHKHSLLHHLCHIVMEKFPEASDLYSEIGAITRASKIDFDELALNIHRLESDCKASWDHLKLIAKHDGSTMMKVKMSDFLADCAERIILLGIVHRRVMNRYHKFLLWMGIPLHRVSDTKPNEFCRIVSEFALEYRTTRERVLQQLEKKANHRERNKTRGKMITEVGKFRTKEDRADAELRQLLGSDISDVESLQGTLPWRRQRSVINSSIIVPNGNLTDDGDDEILESLVKTATKAPSARATPRERKRTRHADRKSLRRTLKNGLSEEEKKHIAAYIKGY